MADAVDIHGTVYKNGTAALLARVLGGNGQPIVAPDISSAKYTVYLLDDQDADSRTPVAGHTSVSLNVGQLIFNALQTDALWTADDIGYNFRHVLDVSLNPAFPTAGRRFLVEFALTPADGQVILVRFRVDVV